VIARIGATSITSETASDRVVARDLVGRVQPIIATTAGEQVDARVGEDPLCDIDRVEDHVRAGSASQDVVAASTDHPVAATATTGGVVIVPGVDMVPSIVADEHIGEPRSIEILDGQERVVPLPVRSVAGQTRVDTTHRIEERHLVAPGAADDDIGSRPTGHAIVPSFPVHGVVAALA
jgi:hypothetical protein